MKTILTLTLSSIAAYFLMLLLPLILIAWLRSHDVTRRTQFDAANCAEYVRTECPNMKMETWIDYWEGYLTG
jgi:hypothetical protein